RGDHPARPTRLAIADYAGFASRLRMQRGGLFEKDRLGARDVLDCLPGNGIGQEADEIAGMAGLEGHADFAVRFESADSRPMSGARVDDDERPARRIEFDTRRRDDPPQAPVDRPPGPP